MAELVKQYAAAPARIAELEKQLAAPRKDSSTSSKPPSSDILKPPRTAGEARRGRKRKRRLGGQAGHKRHERHERKPFLPEEVDTTWLHFTSGRSRRFLRTGNRSTSLRLSSKWTSSRGFTKRPNIVHDCLAIFPRVRCSPRHFPRRWWTLAWSVRVLGH